LCGPPVGRPAVSATLKAVLDGFGRPHAHPGLAIGKPSKHLYECRIGLAWRLVGNWGLRLKGMTEPTRAEIEPLARMLNKYWASRLGQHLSASELNWRVAKASLPICWCAL